MAERATSNITALPDKRVLMPRARTAASIEATSVTWLSPGRLAAGKITILDGDPGLGKSQITIDFAARISRGEPLPGADGWPNRDRVTRPRGVILISSEDGESDTIRPRLDAAEANPNRVVIMDMIDDSQNKYLVEMGKHIAFIERQIEATDAALVVIDPLMAHLDQDAKANSDQDVRRVLSPVASMAERTGCAVLVLRHLNKAQGMAALYRGGGSIGIIGAARVGLLVHKDHDDESGQRRLLMVQKCNIGREVESLAYRIVGDGVSGNSRVEWLGYSSKTADAVMSQPTDKIEREEASEAEIWLRDLLTEGPFPSEKLRSEATKVGIGDRALRRAKSSLGVRSVKTGFGKDGAWVVQLPNQSGQRAAPNPEPDDEYGD